MAMKMQQIIAKAGQQRRASSAYVDILSTKVKQTRGVPTVMCKTKAKVNAKGISKPAGSASTYITTIEVYPKQQVVVSCSCDDFKFTWETALNAKGAARIEYSNGDAPNDRNPQQTPGCCKHLIAVGQMLIDKGKL